MRMHFVSLWSQKKMLQGEREGGGIQYDDNGFLFVVVVDDIRNYL